MRKILNPFHVMPGYNCFACSPNNPIGLRLDFIEDGDEVISHWQATPDYQGWNNVLHGGIQATLMDEVASWLVFVKCKTAGVTSRMDVKLKKPAMIDKGVFTVKAKLAEMRKNIAVMDCVLLDGAQEVCATGSIQYFLYPEQVARERLFFPGADGFFEKV